jgi:hypothetical protein
VDDAVAIRQRCAGEAGCPETQVLSLADRFELLDRGGCDALQQILHSAFACRRRTDAPGRT